MVKKTPHHIEMLFKEFNRRKLSNPRYSLRAFAKFLGMSSPTLSRVLSNNQELSLGACKKIIKKLGFSEYESLIFVRSVAEEKCDRTFRSLTATLKRTDYEFQEGNMLFVSNLENKCIYLNDTAKSLVDKCMHENMKRVMKNIGFDADAAAFFEQCLQQVIEGGEAFRHHLPIETSVGKLSITSQFSPLLGDDGDIKAVASVLFNLNFEVLRGEFVS